MILLFITVITMAQNTELQNLKERYDTFDFKERSTILKKINPEKLSNDEKALYYYLSGQTYFDNSNGSAGLTNFLKSREIYNSLKDYEKVSELSLKIVEVKRLTDYKYDDYKSLIDEAVKYAQQKNNPRLLSKTYKEIGTNYFYSKEPKKAVEYFQKAIIENKKLNDPLFEAGVNMNLGLLYIEKLHQYKLARRHNALAYSYLKNTNENYFLSIYFVNQADLYLKEKKLDSALIMYKKAEALKIKDNNTGVRTILYGLMADLYKEKKDYKKALEYSDKQKVYQNISDDNQQVKAIRDIDAKYQTKEHKSQIAWLQSLTKKGGMLIGVLLLILIFLILGYKNIKKKKKIVEQEKQIETQKLSSALKEQELNEIDKILEGQEKERIKIANDLHDDLGSVLATLKLNFQNLKQQDANNSNELYSKTDKLLEEAYQKVRGIAHTKNAGVIANQGLLTAINNIAEKVSIPGKLNVEVVAFGLEDRLENTLEVTIFRMIQEILTNAIKYAEASEITIHLTQHDDSLNIIIEDNGKGFDPKKINKKDGMGLPNIEKKVEQIGGVFTIDSYQSRGTSIIIDLPL